MKQTTTIIARLAGAGVLAAGLSTVALADTVSVSTSGPDATSSVQISNSTTNTVSNHNTVEVVNMNSQDAVSGDVSANENTSVGSGGSGAASNNNVTATNVAISNSGIGSVSGSTGGGIGNGSGSGGSGGIGNGSGSTGGIGNGAGGLGGSTGGAVLGAATGGMGAGSVATLPEVGAKIPVDVSALRGLYNPTNAAAAAGSKAFDATLIGLASLLSLIGAGVTAMYSRRHARQTV